MRDVGYLGPILVLLLRQVLSRASAISFIVRPVKADWSSRFFEIERVFPLVFRRPRVALVVASMFEDPVAL